MGEAESCDTVSSKLTRGEKHLHEKHGSKHAYKRKLLLIFWSEIAYAMNYKKPCGYFHSKHSEEHRDSSAAYN